MNAANPDRIPCRGRFAPSPTGPLHFGSLVAAVGSRLQARTRGGTWLVRMEDLDPPRERPGAAGEILATLAAFGLHWDEEVLYQSRRREAYLNALETLRRDARLYPCACSRTEIAAAMATGSAKRPDRSLIYPGTCRRGLAPGRKPRALRVVTDDAVISFRDALQGPACQNVGREVGDFVVRRADGPVAYQLAVVIDDAEQGITEIVRGCDLFASTPRQIHLQRLLGLPTPDYAHLPLVTDPRGIKLSKQSRAAPVDPRNPVPALWQALRFLGQRPPTELRRASVRELWEWAEAHWSLQRVPSRQAIPLGPSTSRSGPSDPRRRK